MCVFERLWTVFWIFNEFTKIKRIHWNDHWSIAQLYRPIVHRHIPCNQSGKHLFYLLRYPTASNVSFDWFDFSAAHQYIEKFILNVRITFCVVLLKCIESKFIFFFIMKIKYKMVYNISISTTNRCSYQRRAMFIVSCLLWIFSSIFLNEC